MAQIRTLSDIEEIERVPLAERQLPESTYAMIRQSALTSPDRPALVFFPDGEHYQASVQVTYRQLLGRIHQVANMLSELGVGPNDVVSLLLPNLPQTHFALWGAEVAGIVRSGQSAAGSRPDRRHSAGGTHEGLDCIGTAARLGHLGESGGDPPTGAQSQHRDSGARRTTPGAGVAVF